MELPPVMRITLKGSDNETYVGTLFLRNWTSWLGETFPGWARDDPTKRHAAVIDAHGTRRPDPTGATYYVIAVVLVYGMSIVMLIASHIKRKHAKVLEDRQINKYLQEFQIVRETSSRDSYRNLKRDITAKLKDAGRNHTYRGLTKLSLLPLAAVALPTIRENHLSVDGKTKRKYSLSPRCSISRSSVSSRSSERKYSVLSVESTGRHLSVQTKDRTLKSSGSVDQAFISAKSDNSEAAGGKGGGGLVTKDPLTNPRRQSCPYDQPPGTASGTTNSGRLSVQQMPKRSASKRLQRSYAATNAELVSDPNGKPRKPPTVNEGGHPTTNSSRLSPKDRTVTDTSTGDCIQHHQARKLSASNLSTDVSLAAATARRSIAANLSVDNLSRVFPSTVVDIVPTAETFITAATLPVPSVVKPTTTLHNHLISI